MDNIQKVGMVVVPIIAVVVVIIILTSVGGIDPAINTATGRCDEWNSEIEDMQAEYNGRHDSIGGQFDLDGAIATMRNNINLEMDRYNLECAGEETHYYEENL